MRKLYLHANGAAPFSNGWPSGSHDAVENLHRGQAGNLRSCLLGVYPARIRIGAQDKGQSGMRNLGLFRDDSRLNKASGER